VPGADLGKSCLERSLEHSGGVGTQLTPRTESSVLVICWIVGELDAQTSPPRKLITNVGWSRGTSSRVASTSAPCDKVHHESTIVIHFD
jgi:hypothetical protein